MLDENFIVREPVLDPKQLVLGYQLSLRGGVGAPSIEDADAATLIDFVAEQLYKADGTWLLGNSLLFLDTTSALIASGELAALPPKSVVLILPADACADDDILTALKTMRQEGFGLLLRDADFAGAHKALLPVVSHIELERISGDYSAQAKACQSLKSASTKLIARGVANWEEYDACAALGLDAFINNIYLKARPGSHPKGLNPAQGIILQLMDMVRKNADVRQLEGVLKRDAGLAYKLLRYINSAGFGLGAEIQSLRHAVTMLGYSPLYRWLSLLLATASSTGYSPVLMHTAVVRGRFAELLGNGFLPKSESENLFVAGMFSLLDRLLGIPMDEVLENVQLSESVSQALLSRDGMYGPFLALAEAGEVNNGDIASLADSLFISPRKVNEAHLSALAWAQSLKL